MADEIWMGNIGLFTGLKDRRGTPVHLGDTLEFDAAEWGAPAPDNQFVIEYKDGELRVNGTVSEVSQFCTVIRRFDEKIIEGNLSARMIDAALNGQ